MKLLRWGPLPSVLGNTMMGAKRYQHIYVIGQDEGGFTASYRDNACGDVEATRFIDESLHAPFPTAELAKQACEADLRRLLGRRH